jgi:hypothetical protein
MAWLLRRRGDRRGAAALAADAERTVLKELSSGTRAAALIEVAATRELRGDHAGALESLTRAFDYGARDFAILQPDPIFAPLHSDPAFRALIERMKSDVAVQRERAEARGLLDLTSLMPWGPADTRRGASTP